jgi:hypothetical protein
MLAETFAHRTFFPSPGWRLARLLTTMPEYGGNYNTATLAFGVTAGILHPKVAMPSINSSALIYVHHDKNGLAVRFRGGNAYLYVGVPKRLYDEFMAAPSRGQFLNTRIKPRYPFVKLDKGPKR